MESFVIVNVIYLYNLAHSCLGKQSLSIVVVIDNVVTQILRIVVNSIDKLVGCRWPLANLAYPKRLVQTLFNIIAN